MLLKEVLVVSLKKWSVITKVSAGALWGYIYDCIGFLPDAKVLSAIAEDVVISPVHSGRHPIHAGSPQVIVY